MRASLMIKQGLACACGALVFRPAVAVLDDLDEYINEVKKRKGGVSIRCPRSHLTRSLAISLTSRVFGRRSARYAAIEWRQRRTRPDVERSREYLESFPLDTLGMVGTLHINETMYGLVQTSDGLIHRVIPGNYLGQNDGRITEISESEIGLVEIISDGIGGYIERDAAVGLSD